MLKLRKEHWGVDITEDPRLNLTYFTAMLNLDSFECMCLHLLFTWGKLIESYKVEINKQLKGQRSLTREQL